MSRLLLALLLLLVACGDIQTDPAPPDPSAGGPRRDTSQPFAGFTLSPLSYDQAGFEEFFATAVANGSLVAWVGSWNDLDQGGTLVFDLAERHGYVPVVVTGFPSNPEGGRVLPSDPAEAVDAIASWVAEHPVPFLGFGVEVDTAIWEHSPDDFEIFVEMFDEVAAEVHRVSPDTKVFPGFQLERLRGLKGGLFGGGTVDPSWELLDRFPNADLIGFSTYPGLVFTDPSQMPDGYYAEIEQHTDLPVVFTEVGWQAGGELGDWSGTTDKQARFVELWLPELAAAGDMVIWSFLWDQPGPGAFATMGLIDDQGAERRAFAVWRDLFG